MRANVQRWLTGLGSAFIGGGAGAVTVSIVAPVFSKDFNPINQTGKWLAFVGCTFFVAGLMHLFLFLQQHPLPDPGTIFISNPNPNKDNGGKV